MIRLLSLFHKRKPILRDESGRFVSPHRAAVRAKCREMLERMGKPVPEALSDGH